MAADLRGTTFLVTGSNTGIGRATVADLAQRGGRVVMACRSEEKTAPVIDEIKQSTGNDAVEFHALDLADLDAVRASATAWLARDEPVHVLINNAGVAGPRGLTKQGFEMAFGINHLGHFLFTTMLLDRLRQTDGARIVNVSSDSHYSPKSIDWEALRQPTKSVTGLAEYGVSKLCNVLFTQELARREPTIASYALHPGVIASDVWRRVPWPARAVMKLFMKSTEQGATTSLLCATSTDLAPSGAFYSEGKEKEPSGLATPELGAELWERSLGWTAVDP